MVRHSCVMYRDAEAASAQQVRFAGEAWLRYVPMRAPDAICVRERLPPGASAVLLNRSHTHTDIVLPITARELRLWEAIDGERTIGRLLQGEENVDVARAFFERMYEHDQIVVDTSG